MTQFLFAILAGVLTTLSPCVLPVLPFITASSFNKSKWGPIFLGIGLLVSFVGVSLLVSSTGYLLGIDSDLGRRVAGVLLALSGLLFLLPRLAEAFSSRISFLSNLGSNQISSPGSRTIFSELTSGALLGIVWTPCSGPSLGAAIGLATQSESLSKAATVLICFGIGAVVPMIIIAYSAQSFISKLRKNQNSITVLKKVFGVLTIVFGCLIASNFDRALEAKLTALMPEAWVNLTTKF